ncbi:MAG: hypothetical protein SynsKO_26020 [Synoicihabitans sp.]
MRFLVTLLVVFAMAVLAYSAPARVFVFTDINIDQGDPDDRQSLIHLFWFADELSIQGIVPERWNAGSVDACEMAIAAYDDDFKANDWDKQGYPTAEELEATLAKSDSDAIARFAAAAGASSRDDPLYVLVWGNMRLLQRALDAHPNVPSKIRILTIGTHLLMEKDRPHLPPNWAVMDRPCEQPNWNGRGRDSVFNDARFLDLWWLEMNWTYAGMFTGPEPEQMFEKLGEFGALGTHLHDVVANQPWARYFRVGDTPTVLYLIDPESDRNDPTRSSWAGRFVRPFPQTRPNYYADHAGNVGWNYADPCATWSNHVAVSAHARSTLEQERPEMYRALLEKLSALYAKK